MQKIVSFTLRKRYYHWRFSKSSILSVGLPKVAQKFSQPAFEVEHCWGKNDAKDDVEEPHENVESIVNLRDFHSTLLMAGHHFGEEVHPDRNYQLLIWIFSAQNPGEPGL